MTETRETETQTTEARPPVGRIILGGLIVLVGLGWLLDATDAADIPWSALLPAALILIGVGILFTARERQEGGLVALGVILTLVLVLGASVPTPLRLRNLRGGIGDSVEAPPSIASVEDEYGHAIGKYTVDLSRVDFPAGTPKTIEVSLGIGELTVLVPPAVNVELESQAAIGDVVVFGRQESGISPGIDDTFPATRASNATLQLDVSLGIGKIEVRRK